MVIFVRHNVLTLVYCMFTKVSVTKIYNYYQECVLLISTKYP